MKSLFAIKSIQIVARRRSQATLAIAAGAQTKYISVATRVLTPSLRMDSIMSRVCQVTGKRPMAGNHVSHANNKTKRRFLPNLQKKRFWVASKKRYVTLVVSTKGMRTIDKLGIDAVIAKIDSNKKQAS